MRFVFVCLHGSAKSVIAAEHCRRLAAAQGADVQVLAVGVEPDEHIPPHVVRGLADDGFDVSIRTPQRLTQAHLANADVVVSFGCALEPVGNARAVVRWDDIPAVSDGYAAAREAILERLEPLVRNELSR